MRLASLVRAAVVLTCVAGCHTVSLPAAVRDGVAAPRVDPPREGRGHLVGVVADSANGYPVVGAEVYFTRDSVVGAGPAPPRTDLPRARTDRAGGFALRDLPPGEHTLAFSSLDHLPMRRVVVVRAGLTQSVTLRPMRRGLP